MPVNIPQALDLRLNNHLSYRKIAAIQQVDPSSILRAIQPLLPTQATEIFKENRADVFAEFQRKSLSHCTPSKFKKAGLRDLVVGTGILYDKERLERGLSTENVSYHGLIEQSKSIDEQIQRLERDLARLDGK